MARHSTSKCRHFGSRSNLTGNGSRAGNVSSNREHDDSEIRIWERLEKLFEKDASQVGCSGMYQHNKLTGGTPLHAIPFYGQMIVLKRRNVQSDGSIS